MHTLKLTLGFSSRELRRWTNPAFNTSSVCASLPDTKFPKQRTVGVNRLGFGTLKYSIRVLVTLVSITAWMRSSLPSERYARAQTASTFTSWATAAFFRRSTSGPRAWPTTDRSGPGFPRQRFEITQTTLFSKESLSGSWRLRKLW